MTASAKEQMLTGDDVKERAAQEKKKSKVSLARKNTFQRNNPLH